jgi:Ca-activated chloride channel family protein
MDFAFFRNFGLLEVLLVAFFGLFYVAYLLRTVYLARRIHATVDYLLVKLILRTVYMALLLVAFLGPIAGETAREIKSVGKDIFFAVDLSKSMEAIDVQPSRLGKIKLELINLVNQLGGDRIGLIIFTNDVFMQCPLTFDKSAVKLFIETLNTDIMSSYGTDFGPPLKMALDKMLQGQEERGKATSKAIVLISDGEDFGEGTEEAIRVLSDAGIRVFTVGVGTLQGSKIPQGMRYKTDQTGMEVVTRLNDDVLKKIARATNGRYFEVSDQKNEMPRLESALNALEGELMDARFVDVAANRYHIFLLIALALIVLDLVFTLKVMRIA